MGNFSLVTVDLISKGCQRAMAEFPPAIAIRGLAGMHVRQVAQS